jgi:hypothetical protein
MSKPTNAAIVDLNGRKWQPFDTQAASGYVTYTEGGGEIHIPYGTDPLSTTIQAHELAHVRYTAKLWPNSTSALKRLTALAKTKGSIVGYAEDMRITALAGRLGIKTLPVLGNPIDQPILEKWIESFVAAGIPMDRVVKVARFITAEHTSVLKTIGLRLDTLQDKANAEAYIVHCAGYIHKLLSKGEEPEDKGQSDKGEAGKDKSEPTPSSDLPEDKPESKDKPEAGDDSEDSEGKGAGDSEAGDDSEGEDESAGGDEGDSDDSEDGPETGEGDSGDDPQAGKGEGKGDGDNDASTDGGGAVIDLDSIDLPDLRAAMVAGVPKQPDTQALIQEFQHTLNTANWIPVTAIDRMPLVRRAAQSRNRGRKLSETGVALGSAYDAVAPNERRPFVAKRRGGIGGLTVAIDCSGSMSIEPRQLERLLLTHPQGVVVTYSSKVGRYSPEGEKAIVRVIASHGRVAATSDFREGRAGGNGCDGPVLEWLAKQSGDRVWICDGGITGKGDKGVAYNYFAMAAWLKAHHITRFGSLDEYLESLSKR